MSYQYQKNGITGKSEIIINGFEKGIADSPYQGIADIRNFNITTSPNQANVEFATSAVTLPPTGFTGTAFTANSGTDILTTASTTGFYNGMALTIVTTSGAGGLTNGRTYYVGDTAGAWTAGLDTTARDAIGNARLFDSNSAKTPAGSYSLIATHPIGILSGQMVSISPYILTNPGMLIDFM